MSRHVLPQNQRRSSTWKIAGVVAIVLVAVLAGLQLAGSSAPTAASPAPHFVDLAEADHHTVAGQRTVIIAQAGTQLPISGTDGTLMTTLVEGQVPDGATQATVRTDTDCAPDAQGVSHCHNQLDVDGTLFTVQHHHKMSTTPCLTPGETVAIARA